MVPPEESHRRVVLVGAYNGFLVVSSSNSGGDSGSDGKRMRRMDGITFRKGGEECGREVAAQSMPVLV